MARSTGRARANAAEPPRQSMIAIAPWSSMDDVQETFLDRAIPLNPEIIHS
jgi:hypothetical protein